MKTCLQYIGFACLAILMFGLVVVITALSGGQPPPGPWFDPDDRRR